MYRKILQFNKEQLTVAYKLLHDILFISLVFFFLALLAEGALPGIVTNHLSFSRVIVFIFLNLVLIYVLGDNLKISLKNKPGNKKTAYLLLGIMVLLVINSMLKINIFLDLFITAIVIISGYYTYKTLLEEA